MNDRRAKLLELQAKLKQTVKDLEQGKIDHIQAADKITELREEMDNLGSSKPPQK
jgi:hypothetical protein